MKLRSCVIVAGLSLLAYVSAFAQTKTTPRPTFDTASIRVSRGPAPMSLHFDAATFSATGMTLRNLVELAYNIRDFQLQGGPDWTGSIRYDIDAKSKPATQEQQLLRLRALLADRFELQMHRSTDAIPLFLLVPAASGPKLSELRDGQLMSMKILASSLSAQLDRPVVDETGLQGNYFVKLNWTSDDGQPKALGQDGAGKTANPKSPSIFTAIKDQLGLELRPQKAPVAVLVIDAVSPPATN